MDNKEEQPVSARERFHNTLKERAAQIDSVMVDVFTIKYYQLVINFIIGLAAVALLVVSMIAEGLTRGISVIGAIVLLIAAVCFYLALKSRGPLSYMQYAERKAGEVCTVQIIKNRYILFCANGTVEFNGMSASELPAPVFPEYAFDFFTNMSVDVRIGAAGKETFSGTIEINGKTKKCKVVFKNGAIYRAVVGGVRLKYFDVNDRREKINVPAELFDAAKKFGVVYPKLDGIKVNKPRGGAR